MFNTKAARRIYKKQGESPNFVANVFNNMVSETNCCAMLLDDYVMHKPGMNEDKYCEKLVWRVKNNLFASEGVGFSARTKTCGYLKFRQLLFIPYSVLVVPVMVDAIKMAIKNKDIYFLKHIYWNEYVFVTIVKYVLCKIFHIPVEMKKEYGKR